MVITKKKQIKTDNYFFKLKSFYEKRVHINAWATIILAAKINPKLSIGTSVTQLANGAWASFEDSSYIDVLSYYISSTNIEDHINDN